MAITLQEAKVGMTNKVDQKVIDTFRRSSLLLDKMIFDDCISPGTGGSTLGYSYIQLKTPSTAGVRQINNEYTANEANRTEKMTKAIIMGGSFELDRVIQKTSGAIDEMAFQLEQKVKATANYFHNLVINGQAGTDGEGFTNNTFDGLRKLLEGASTAVDTTISLENEAAMDSNKNAFLDELDSFLSLLDGTPDMLLMNTAMLNKFRSIGRRAGYYNQTRDDFGRVVEEYNGIILMDAGKYYNGTATVDTINTIGGKTDIYAISLGLDGFHGISPTGSKIIETIMPDFNEPGAVKKGEVELVAGVALKNTLKAGVLKGISISPAGKK